MLRWGPNFWMAMIFSRKIINVILFFRVLASSFGVCYKRGRLSTITIAGREVSSVTGTLPNSALSLPACASPPDVNVGSLGDNRSDVSNSCVVTSHDYSNSLSVKAVIEQSWTSPSWTFRDGFIFIHIDIFHSVIVLVRRTLSIYSFKNLWFSFICGPTPHLKMTRIRSWQYLVLLECF